MAGHRVLIIGLDGATFRLLRPWMAQGKMPSLSALTDGGVSGVLESTYPPLTAPAWTSFMTGKNPGKHGIFDFRRHQLGSYQTVAVNSRFNRQPTLWCLASQHNREVIVCNVPMTYPPEPVNGAMISGRIVPGADSVFTYPPKLHSRITRDIGDYILEVDWEDYGEDQMEEFLADLSRCTTGRVQAFLCLMENYDWDLGVLVLTGTDMIQHCAWAYCDQTHPRYSQSEADKHYPRIIAYFQLVDSLIGQVLQHAGLETNVIVMSDHGFGPLHRKVNLNQYLAELGFLVRKWTGIGSLAPGSTASAMARMAKLLRRVFSFPSMGTGVGRRLKLDSLAHVIDWSKTKAYSNSYRGIQVNLIGRDPQGVVGAGKEYEQFLSFLLRQLQGLTDPENDNKVIESVYCREQVYWGPYVPHAPDLLVDFGDNPYDAYPTRYEDERLFQDSDWHTGAHRMNGIFIGAGPIIKAGKVIRGLRLTDVAPTTLHMLGCPIPQDMDGRVLKDIFSEDYVASTPIQYVEMPRVGNGEFRNGWADLQGEEEMVLERLRALGYLD